MTTKTIVDEKQASIYIGMSASFLRQARSRGNLANQTPGPPFLKLSRAVRYRVTDLDRWLEENRREK